MKNLKRLCISRGFSKRLFAEAFAEVFEEALSIGSLKRLFDEAFKEAVWRGSMSRLLEAAF